MMVMAAVSEEEIARAVVRRMGCCARGGGVHFCVVRVVSRLRRKVCRVRAPGFSFSRIQQMSRSEAAERA